MTEGPTPINALFSLTGRVAIITGGTGVLGMQHAEAILGAGGIPVLVDLPHTMPPQRAAELQVRCGARVVGIEGDVTDLESVERALQTTLSELGRVDILINNAANNPKVEGEGGSRWTRVENFPVQIWDQDIAVGLTGAFYCSRVFGSHMAANGGGVVLNVASDLALISPDQRLYRNDELADSEQPVKPITYSVVKTGLLGLTRYLATYWARERVRVNAICPGGVFNGQPSDFVARLSERIPLGRMAALDEYKGTVVYMCSDASSYMTGSIVAVDGGRTAW